MRVIAGKCRSLQLKTPKGLDTRPTQDRIKETLFNILQNDLPGAVFVDLFAGSGGIGIEALSRGASKAYFVDKSIEAVSCIKSNLEFTRLTEASKVIKADVISSLALIDTKKADIIFADPPYEGGFEEKLFEGLKNQTYVSGDTLIILESSINKEFSFEGYEIIKVKKYKTNKHTFFRRIS